MKKLILATTICILALTSGFSLTTYADDRYITDVVYIPLRADKDNQAGILKNSLGSGTKFKFIREEEDAYKNKWSLVLSPDGVEGWIRSQNLQTEPTASIKLEAFTKSSSNVVDLQKENLMLKNDLENLNATYKALLKDTEAMRTSTTSDINMEQENQNMHREYQLLQTDRDVLKAENDQLKSSDRYNQRIIGGGLILCGVVLSFLLQMFGKRKRHSEWN